MAPQDMNWLLLLNCKPYKPYAFELGETPAESGWKQKTLLCFGKRELFEIGVLQSSIMYFPVVLEDPRWTTLL